MKDTHPEILARYRTLMKNKSPEERLSMGCSMYDAAKQIVMSAIRNRNPQISHQAAKEQLFLRFYGTDFTEKERKKIQTHLCSKIEKIL